MQLTVSTFSSSGGGLDALKLNEKREDAGQEDLKKLGKYPAKTHARRVAKELNVKAGLIYLPGSPSVDYEDSDQGVPIRQRRYFYYLSGVKFADSHLTYDIESDTLTLFIPYVPPRQILWYGKTPNASQAKALYDVDHVRYNDDLDSHLQQHLQRSLNKDLYVLHANQIPAYHSNADIILGKLQRAMNLARVVKTDYEIAMIRQANKVSSLAHRKVAEHLLNMTNEREIEALHQGVCTAQGARNQAYAIIAGAGINASTLHYDDNDQPLQGKQVVVVDAGCEWDLYASDITRSLPLAGRWEGKAAQIHSLVQKMQEACIASVKPGLAFYQLQVLATKIAVEGLLALGVLQGSKKDILKAGTGSAFFPHGLGHHVGLEVHDVTGAEKTDLLSLRERGHSTDMVGKRVLVDSRGLSALVAMVEKEEAEQGLRPYASGGQILGPNMIITVEPGVYFCREFIEGYYLNNPDQAKFINKEVLEQYYPVGGIRIEDCILVTEDGYENLTTAPKGDELVEIIQKGPGHSN